LQRRSKCGLGSPVTSLLFHTVVTSLLLAVGHDNSFVTIWDISIHGSGDLMYSQLFGDELDTLDKVRSLALSADGSLLVVGQQDGWLQFFDMLGNGSEIVGTEHLKLPSDVGTVAFSPQQDWLAASSITGIHFFGQRKESTEEPEKTTTAEFEPTQQSTPAQEQEGTRPPSETQELQKASPAAAATPAGDVASAGAPSDRLWSCQPKVSLVVPMVPVGLLLIVCVFLLVRAVRRRRIRPMGLAQRAFLAWAITILVLIGAGLLSVPGFRCDILTFIEGLKYIAGGASLLVGLYLAYVQLLEKLREARSGVSR
jgi:hypothetical protein